MNTLLLSVPTTMEEAEAFLQRTDATPDREQIVSALNAAASWMEGHTRRRLVSRTWRDPVVIEGVDATANEALITGMPATDPVELGDPVFGSLLAAGSQVRGIGPTFVSLNTAAIETGTFTVTFGSAPLVLDGNGKRAIYLPERPVDEVFAARAIASDGTETDIDVTGCRLDQETGLLMLTSGDFFPRGDANIEVECRAGYQAPSSTAAGHPEWPQLQWVCHRLAQCFFQDWKNALGRVADKSLGNATFRFVDFDPPKDITNALQPFVRLW